ncbi:helix-turn-helix protein [Mitsuokella sp. oral taxon 131 str. W9106]|nr:helix-turn-helix protein [Mitsuokella sp. oral taxon 131 str. W9106]
MVRVEVWMNQFLHLSALFDLYGSLLTGRQQDCLRMHLYEDFSLSEIAETLGISRQAVYDNIHRSTDAMESYEKKMRLAARYQKERLRLNEIYEAVLAMRDTENAEVIDAILSRFEPFLRCMREV